MKHLLALLLSVLPAFAAEHIISWQSNPTNEQVMAYLIYEQMGSPPAWVRRLDVLAPALTGTLMNVTSGWHTYAVSATNAVGVGPMSQPVSAFVPVFPTAPTNVIIQLRASIETGPATGIDNIAQYWLPFEATGSGACWRAILEGPTLVATIQSGNSAIGPWNNLASLPLPTEHPALYRATLLAIK